MENKEHTPRQTPHKRGRHTLPDGIEKPGLYFESDKLRKAATKILATIAIFDAAYLGLYKAPIAAEEHRLSQTHASLSQVFTAEDPLNADTSTLIIGGVGTRNSEPIAEALSPLDKLGNIDSIEEDNSGVYSETVAKQIIERAEKNGIKEIGLWGDSAGGIFDTKIARYIQESNSPLRVRFIMYDCTPPNYDTLRESEKKKINALNFWATLLPGIEYYPAVNYFYTGANMGENPVYAASGIHQEMILDEMYNQETPSPALLRSQVSLIVDSNMENDLKAISAVTTKPTPLLLSIAPTSPTGDKVVNSRQATEQLADIASKYNLPFYAYTIDGISHGDPTANRQAYQDKLKSDIMPYILNFEQERNRPRALNNSEQRHF